MDLGAYCRDVESYLCRKNDGHLIRIVGPAFELVCQWASGGIPPSVVCRAIDRTYTRYYAKGPKRHPMRIEYCEADVLNLFDDWKRAVGMGTRRMSDDDHNDQHKKRIGSAGRRHSLVAHIDQLITRLETWRPPGIPEATIGAQVNTIIRELGDARDWARNARGEARGQLVSRLGDLDRELLDNVRRKVDATLRKRLRTEAERDLMPFRERMPPAAFQEAVSANADRLLIEHVELPRLSYD